MASGETGSCFAAVLSIVKLNCAMT